MCRKTVHLFYKSYNSSSQSGVQGTPGVPKESSKRSVMFLRFIQAGLNYTGLTVGHM